MFLFAELIETDFHVCFFLVGCVKTEEEEAARSEEDSSSSRGSGVCKWFNVRMGFGFLSMTHRVGICLDSPVDVFVHQVREREHAVVLMDRTCGRPSLSSHGFIFSGLNDINTGYYAKLNIYSISYHL